MSLEEVAAGVILGAGVSITVQYIAGWQQHAEAKSAYYRELARGGVLPLLGRWFKIGGLLSELGLVKQDPTFVQMYPEMLRSVSSQVSKQQVLDLIVKELDEYRKDTEKFFESGTFILLPERITESLSKQHELVYEVIALLQKESQSQKADHAEVQRLYLEGVKVIATVGQELKKGLNL